MTTLHSKFQAVAEAPVTIPTHLLGDLWHCARLYALYVQAELARDPGDESARDELEMATNAANDAERAMGWPQKTAEAMPT
jgi:hypothetical protein